MYIGSIWKEIADNLQLQASDFIEIIWVFSKMKCADGQTKR